MKKCEKYCTGLFDGIRYDLISELERVINLILAYPQGLSVLLGTVPPPSAMDIVLAFPSRSCDNLGIRAASLTEQERIVEAADRIENIISMAGGWEHITRTIYDWRKSNSADWSLVVDHIRHVKHSGHRWLGGAKLNKIAESYKCSERTASKKRRLFAGVLAEYILSSPIEFQHNT
jgi:beta-galactosidase GanA